MGFAPVFLLFACWADKGWEIFKGYAALFLNTWLKRIAVAFLLVLSLIINSVAINLMNDTSWWQGIIMMVALLLVPIVAFTQESPSTTFDNINAMDSSLLDPFAGTGTTLQAARDKGFHAIGIEQDADYIQLINARLETVDGGLF